MVGGKISDFSINCTTKNDQEVYYTSERLRGTVELILKEQMDIQHIYIRLTGEEQFLTMGSCLSLLERIFKNQAINPISHGGGGGGKFAPLRYIPGKRKIGLARRTKLLRLLF